MSAANPSSLRATVEGFDDATPYDPLLYGEDMTEEQLAHFMGSNSHSPNPQSNSSFSPPPNDSMAGHEEPPSAGTVQHRYSDLFEFARIDSGFRVGSGFSQLGGLWDPNANGEDFAQTREPADTIVSNDTIEGPPSRKSSGLATQSEHSRLLSPTLTNSTLSPTSPHVGSLDASRPYKLLGGGQDMTRDPSQSTGQMTSMTSHPQFQHTPSSKASSHTSPEPTNNTHLSSPIVTVSRHDSPARPGATAPVAGKRPLDDSNFLAPEYALEIGDDESGDSGRGRSGLSPSARLSHDPIPSINEEALGRELDSRNITVETWAMGNAIPYLDPADALAPGGVNKLLGGRIRAKSTSKDSRALRHDAFSSNRTRREAQNRSTPGPNLLVDEESGDESEDEGGSSQESAPASVDGRLVAAEEATSPFGHLDPTERPWDSYPWVDPIYLPSRPGEKSQPETANAAMARFMMRNRDIETASRAATWGTRRMSDSTLDQVLGDRGLFSRLRLTSSKDRDNEPDETRTSLQEGVAHVKQIYRSIRSNSVNKRKPSDPIRKLPRTDTYQRPVSPHSRRPSNDRKGSSASLEKIFSHSPSQKSQRYKTVSRPTTPRLNTGALAAITTAGLGMAGMDGSSTSPSGPSSPTHNIMKGLKEIRDGLRYRLLHESQGSTGIADMLSNSGGPPVAPVGTLSPPGMDGDDDDAHSESKTVKAIDEDDEDARTTMGEPVKGVKMDMSPRKDLIIPNFDGFKTNVRDVNPRLDEWLVERLGQEQLRRYKRLVEYKIAHIKHVEFGTCPSKEYCAAGANQKRYFQLPKSAHKDSIGSIDAEVPLDALDEDEQAIAEGAVSEAQFPLGLPMPPVERLPAEFECPYCFQVKKFTKPSDWSKHVHEDMQPFTCTFKHCSDPKSFKRKADWVRHENERHRQLEWWECTEEGCQHRCYRRDNFVQHLIREHKLPEPPNKPAKQPNKPAVRGPAKNKGRKRGNTANINDVPPEEKVLLMVETCRHDTTKSANEEKCRFCGNVCNSWKKLTVHLARHMEQLSIPVLKLVEIREVNIDTQISPLEQRPPMQLTPSPIEQQLQQQQHHANNPSALAFTSPSSAFSSVSSTGQMAFNTAVQPMQPAMFAPGPIPGSFNQAQLHSHAHSFAPDNAAAMYNAGWQQTQNPMQFAPSGAAQPAYPGMQQQHQHQAAYSNSPVGAGAGAQQASFDPSLYMNDAEAYAAWSAHAGNAQGYGGMGVGFAQGGQGQQQHQNQNQNLHQQHPQHQHQHHGGHQQQQYYGPGW